MLGSRTVAIGWNALNDQSFSSTTETYNTAVGYEAGAKLTSGTANTIVGGLAGDALTTGNRNTLIGFDAGYDVAMTGTGNIVIGDYARVSSTTQDVAIVLGSQSISC